MENKAIFFDRDGVLNKDIGYLYKSEDFFWTDGAVEAIKYCNDNGYKVVVVTNQSGVARGYYTEADVHKLHDWINNELYYSHAHIDAFYYCPHHTKGKVAEYTMECDCRKPAPGMINRACRELSIDSTRSFMIGDKDSDMECAANAGVTGVKYTGGNLLTVVKKMLEKE